MTKPGGFCAIVIGTVLLDGDLYPVPFDIVPQLVRKGWAFHQDIVWHKCTAGVKRAGVTIQHPHPGYYYPNIMNEYIMIFRKPGPKIYKGRSAEEKAEATYPIDRVFTMDVANSVWHIAPVPPGHIDHPCPFPEEIPYRLRLFGISRGAHSGCVTRVPHLGARHNFGLDTGVAHLPPSY